MICPNCKQAEVGISEPCPNCKTFNLVPRYRIVPEPETDAPIIRTVFLVVAYDEPDGVFSTYEKAQAYIKSHIGHCAPILVFDIDSEAGYRMPNDTPPAPTSSP